MYSNDYEFTVLYHQQAVQFARNERRYRIVEELLRIRRRERWNRVTALVRHVFRSAQAVAVGASERVKRRLRRFGLEIDTGVPDGRLDDVRYRADGGR